ncbi:serine/threonine-protein phosphatase [Streptomyces longhuiensis]|uniref:serine/threonine-protein phosphatase n=1 Tax=Streptomyces longhuiensis TaxID=2880933 RepID=UPI0022230B41|nr:serine/threonine-protein phosphatase [Streptomyces longhuiensis]
MVGGPGGPRVHGGGCGWLGRIGRTVLPNTPAVASSVLGATCLYAVYDPVTRRCTLARAGHLPPATCHLPPATCHLPPLRLTALSSPPTANRATARPGVPAV